jgi:glutamyl-tRNA reductase
LARARKLLARGDNPEDVLDAMARSLTHKMLHGAYAELNAADEEHRAQVTDSISRLFLRRSSRSTDGGDTQL